MQVSEYLFIGSHCVLEVSIMDVGERQKEGSVLSKRRDLVGSRSFGLTTILLSYILAVYLGVKVYGSFGSSMFIRLYVADVAATLFIWVISTVFRNASAYDPYWSVQPVVILGLLMLDNEVSYAVMVFFALIAVWGVRLTANWVRTFKGLGSQDWRYNMIRDISGPLYPLANLIGIQMMPTTIVFGCILPGVVVVTEGASFNLTATIGLTIICAGIVLEAAADYQMHVFKRQTKDRAKIIRSGLWKHSRHPNYLGEVMVWWGTFIFMVASHPDKWFLVIGTIANTALFLFISVPMAERRLSKYKEGFAKYKEETRMFLPWPKRRAV